jgi:hypothetical protein
MTADAEDHHNVQIRSRRRRPMSKRPETSRDIGLGQTRLAKSLLISKLAGSHHPRQELATCLAENLLLVSQSLPFCILHHCET